MRLILIFIILSLLACSNTDTELVSSDKSAQDGQIAEKTDMILENGKEMTDQLIQFSQGIKGHTLHCEIINNNESCVPGKSTYYIMDAKSDELVAVLNSNDEGSYEIGLNSGSYCIRNDTQDCRTRDSLYFGGHGNYTKWLNITLKSYSKKTKDGVDTNNADDINPIVNPDEQLKNKAIDERDESHCADMSTIPKKDWCFNEIAFFKNDTNICEKIIDANKQEMCHLFIGIHIQDHSLCARHSNTMMRDWCYHEIALAKEDSSICDNIIDGVRRENCITLDSTKI